jgi:membrane-associated protein TcaA
VGKWVLDSVVNAEIEQVETEVASSTSDSDEEDDAITDELTEEEVISEAQQFVLDFRAAYEKALNQRDFSLIDPFLLTDSVAYKELVEFVGELKNESYTYDFTHNETTDGMVHDYGDILIDTYEVFDFTNRQGKLTHYEREKTYYLELDDDGDFKIYSILIRDTIRE